MLRGRSDGVVHVAAPPRRGRGVRRDRVRRARARPRAAGARPDGGRGRGRLRGGPRRGPVAAGLGDPAIAQDRAALFDGGARFTAPSLVFRHEGRTLVAGGFQSFEAYDVCVANLAPGLPRRPPPEPLELLAEYPAGLTTVEVAQVCRGRNDPPDIAGTEAALVSLAESGGRSAAARSAMPRASGSPLPDRLILVRHGATAWNAEGRFTTRTDVELSPTGREEAGPRRGRLPASGSNG